MQDLPFSPRRGRKLRKIKSGTARAIFLAGRASCKTSAGPELGRHSDREVSSWANPYASEADIEDAEEDVCDRPPSKAEVHLPQTCFFQRIANCMRAFVASCPKHMFCRRLCMGALVDTQRHTWVEHVSLRRVPQVGDADLLRWIFDPPVVSNNHSAVNARVHHVSSICQIARSLREGLQMR